MFILIFCVLIFPVSSNKITYKFNICGVSMLPLNKDNYCNLYDVNTVTSNDIVQVNDIVCFNYDKRIYNKNTRYICHRVISIDNDLICTKGDNNYYKDKCINKKYVALKVLI